MALCTICPELASDARSFVKIQNDSEGEERIRFGIGECQNTMTVPKFDTQHQTFAGLSGFHHGQPLNHSCSMCYSSDELANAQERSKISQVKERFFLLPRSTVKASSVLIPCGDTKCRVSETNTSFLRSSFKTDEQFKNIPCGIRTLTQSSRLTSKMRETGLTSDPCGARLASSGCETKSSAKKCVPREVSSFPKSFSRTNDENAVASIVRHTIRYNVNIHSGGHRAPQREVEVVPQEILSLKPEATALAATDMTSERTQVNIATITTAAATMTTTTKVVRGSQPLLVFVLLLLFSPTFALSASRLDPSRGTSSGQYDRGGPQHRITWGRGNPQASAVFGDTPTNVTAIVGHRARLPCTVRNLGLKDVTWIRQRDLHILTVGISTYTTDDRFTVYHPPETEDWFLDVSSVTFRDGGIYECQVTTSPKVSLPVQLTVLAEQQATIQGPKEVYIRTGSTISLVCEVSASWEAVGPVRWFLGRKRLDYSSPRGGISMEVEKTPTHTTSKLFITRAVKSDSGEYNCAPKYAKPSSVTIHIVNGEESRAVHSGGQAVVSMSTSSCAQLVFVCVIFLCARQTRRWH